MSVQVYLFFCVSVFLSFVIFSGFSFCLFLCIFLSSIFINLSVFVLLSFCFFCVLYIYLSDINIPALICLPTPCLNPQHLRCRSQAKCRVNISRVKKCKSPPTILQSFNQRIYISAKIIPWTTSKSCSLSLPSSLSTRLSSKSLYIHHHWLINGFQVDNINWYQR